MRDYIINRAVNAAQFLCKNKSTIRETARKFGVSKSTIHVDLTERLIEIDKDLYHKTKEVLEHNKAVRHIRGGESTRKFYQEG